MVVTGAMPGGVAPRVAHAADIIPPAPPPPRPPIVGFVDTHVHQFANLGFGGLEFWGSPMDPTLDPTAPDDDARARALPTSDFIFLTSSQVVEQAAGDLPVILTPSATSCDDGACWAQCPAGTGVTGNACWRVQIHGSDGKADLLNEMVGSDPNGHGVMGYPDLDGWPSWDVLTDNLLVNGSFFNLVAPCDQLEWRSNIRAMISTIKTEVEIAFGLFFVVACYQTCYDTCTRCLQEGHDITSCCSCSTALRLLGKLVK